ncbi:MAG: cell division protein FtsZ [Flavobacteriaceae bacterium]|jgi:cell division protein FtsZ|tara:strand:- start:581 stop:2788 length:2208 start_codon:yes stop_codon:yes gene_type:complete
MHNQFQNMDQEEIKGINFDLPKNKSNVIKVLGVGGGGSNAINYMFQQGIKGVDFIISNTDAQALAESGVPTKIQLGASLTEGLGAGANPEVGASAALESQEEIQALLSTQTKMIFITAGMGGGTGTGAAPVIAQMARSLDILTVGIVTMPFQFEGKLRLDQAQKGLEKIKSSVDALIVINNNKLREVYGNLGFKAGFAKADEVLATAARGIAEVITHHYTQNIDLKDAKTVLTNSGTAIMGSGSASGSNRSQEAIIKALDSPLLNDNKITGCKNVLLLIVSGSDEITIDEIGEINDFIQAEAGNHTNIIMGVGEDENLGNEVSVTIIATGFGQEQQNDISNTEAKKIIHTLEEDQNMVHDLSDKNPTSELSSSFQSYNSLEQTIDTKPIETPQKFVAAEEPIIKMNTILCDLEVDYEVVNSIPTEIEEQISVQELPVLKKQELFTSTFQEEEELIVDKVKIEEAFENDEMLFSIQDEEEVASKEDAFGPIPAEMKTQITTDNSTAELEEINIGNSFFDPQFEMDSPLIDDSQVIVDTDLSEVVREEEFIINEVSPVLSDIEVVDPELLEQENQIQLDFELPLGHASNEEIQFIHLEEEEFQKVTDTLNSEFDEASLELTYEIKEETVALSEDKIVQERESEIQPEAEIDPFDQSIDKSIATQSEKRRAHLKSFNHKFKHQFQRIDDMTKEPAYKRKGLDLDSDLPDTPSRTSLSNDFNDDLQLRSNNSFLHDNVD